MKICKKCHIEKPFSEYYKSRRYSDGVFSSCKSCYSSYQYSEKNKEKTRIRNVKKEKRRDGYHVEYALMKKYGITVKQYEEMAISQEYKCKICLEEKKGDKRMLYVDHCHKTGKIRGLLCQKCNSGIGLFSDNIIFLERAIDYLTK